MSITSLSFILFLTAVLVLYFLVPRRYQWVVLLLASVVFYLSCGLREAVYVLITASTIYGATVWMEHLSGKQKQYLKDHRELTKEEKGLYKDKVKRQRKAILIVTLLINFGLLCTFKYIHFFLAQVNSLSLLFGGRGIEDHIRLIVPLGISFYTFQSTGYLLDVYWGYYPPERNYLKVLLFVSFFPQMTQGPISEFEQLSKELFTEHRFDYKNFTWGFQRALWGFTKKLLLANTLAPYVANVFENYQTYSGISVFIGALCYSVQIYADFSGYMDIMCGFCEMLGIRLTENFERPYFAKSVTEYWRRWHISLGAWFRKYIYYPIGMSNWSRKLAKNSRKKYGKHFSNAMPATIALVITWLATGLWHGASWAYIVWGGVNGLFIILSLWLEPAYARCRQWLQINEDAWLWRAFQTIRTFLLVTFIKVLPEVGTLRQGLGLWKRIFTNHTIPHSVRSLLPFVDWSLNITQIEFGVAILVTIALFVSSLLQRKQKVRVYFNRIPWFLRIVILSIVIIVVIAFGVPTTWGAGGFLYANF